MSELTIVVKVSLEEPIEPPQDGLEAEHALPRGATTAQVVGPVREPDELDVSSEQTQTGEELLGLLDRTAVIFVRVQQ